MSKMSNLLLEIEELHIAGLSEQEISNQTGMPLQFVLDALENFLYNDDSYDDSMDGDEASALASAGWGTDEDYGGDIDDVF
jgi:hypothetical protein